MPDPRIETLLARPVFRTALARMLEEGFSVEKIRAAAEALDVGYEDIPEADDA